MKAKCLLNLSYIERANMSVARGLPVSTHIYPLLCSNLCERCLVLALEISVLKGGFHLNLT